MSLEKRDYRIRTEHVERSDESRSLGKGDFGTVERADIVTRVLRENDLGEWRVERERVHPDEFVTKTFHRETAIEDARHSVECYNELRAAGVQHIPGTHRVSDADPRVVISTFLGKDSLLITTNSVPEREKRPVEIDDASFVAMLADLKDDLDKIAACHRLIAHEDAIFFELQMNGEVAEHVDFVFADFDNVTKASEASVEQISQNNLIQATRSLFWLMMSQRVIPGADPTNDNWARIGSHIQLWADSLGVDTHKVHDDYVEELRARIAKDAAEREKGE